MKPGEHCCRPGSAAGRPRSPGRRRVRVVLPRPATARGRLRWVRAAVRSGGPIHAIAADGVRPDPGAASQPEPAPLLNCLGGTHQPPTPRVSASQPPPEAPGRESPLRLLPTATRLATATPAIDPNGRTSPPSTASAAWSRRPGCRRVPFYANASTSASPPQRLPKPPPPTLPPLTPLHVSCNMLFTCPECAPNAPPPPDGRHPHTKDRPTPEGQVRSPSNRLRILAAASDAIVVAPCSVSGEPRHRI